MTRSDLRLCQDWCDKGCWCPLLDWLKHLCSTNLSCATSPCTNELRHAARGSLRMKSQSILYSLLVYYDLPCWSTTKSATYCIPFNFSPWKAHPSDRLDLRVLRAGFCFLDSKQDSGTMWCWPVLITRLGGSCIFVQTLSTLKAPMDSGVSARPSWKLMVLTTTTTTTTTRRAAS